MSAVEKFLFENSFDVMEQAGSASNEAEEEIVKPTFTQEQLDAARDEGFVSGRREGASQAAEETERLTAQAQQTISDQITAFIQAQEQTRDEIIEGAMTIAAAITRKVFPELERRHSLDEVCQLVETTLSRQMDAPRITIHVSETLHQHVAESLQALAVSKGYGGQLIVLEDGKLATGDCRIDWKNGIALRDTAAIWRSIDEVIERNTGKGFLALAETGGPGDDGPVEEQGDPFDHAQQDGALQDEEIGDQPAAGHNGDAGQNVAMEDTESLGTGPIAPGEIFDDNALMRQPADTGAPVVPDDLDSGNP